MSNLAYNVHTLPVRVPVQCDKYPSSNFASDYSAFHAQSSKCHSTVPINIQEKGEQYVICIYVGDNNPEDCSVILYDGMLMIGVNHNHRDNHHNTFPKLANRLCESFRFTTVLPETADIYGISAYHMQNILKIIIPKIQ
ncbi:MAG: Hsp20 family protein [Gammaproteobacteria bacterium]|nr:Hsp20 family protein [Gammaproteobacteria bacterium]